MFGAEYEAIYFGTGPAHDSGSTPLQGCCSQFRVEGSFRENASMAIPAAGGDLTSQVRVFLTILVSQFFVADSLVGICAIAIGEHILGIQLNGFRIVADSETILLLIMLDGSHIHIAVRVIGIYFNYLLKISH